MLVLCLLSVVAGCVPSQVRHRQELVSRDYSYIDFTQNAAPLTIVADVGGEHMTYYKVLAFQGDRFRITVADLDGETSTVISGDGIRIRKGPDATVFQRLVEVEALDTLFSVELDAHPYGRYRLIIEKL
ncbi:hypothetical protein [Pseudodesulfovibrio mercurii]|nr:hypothetical protein [Pseudodesulfovibrio mercurii]